MDLPRPEVTVTDPRRPGRCTPVEQPDPPRLSRRGAALLAAAAVLAASVLSAADVLRDRREAAEQRRLDGVLELAVSGLSGAWAASHDPRTGTGTVEGLVRLDNSGPRDLRVTAARLGPLRSADEHVLDAGGGGAVLLRRTVDCPADGSAPPHEPAARQLHVDLETPTGPRRVALAATGLAPDLLDDSVQWACLHPPLGESLEVSSTVVRLEGRTAVVEVVLTNEGRRPVRLLSLVPARGLVVRSVAGDATGLPVVLPVRTGRASTARTLELRLGAVCGALRSGHLPRQIEQLSAIVEDEERSQLTPVGLLSADPQQLLRQLAERTCSSGWRAS